MPGGTLTWLNIKSPRAHCWSRERNPRANFFGLLDLRYFPKLQGKVQENVRYFTNFQIADGYEKVEIKSSNLCRAGNPRLCSSRACGRYRSCIWAKLEPNSRGGDAGAEAGLDLCMGELPGEVVTELFGYFQIILGYIEQIIAINSKFHKG